MASMKDAIQHGADMVEFDVQVNSNFSAAFPLGGLNISTEKIDIHSLYYNVGQQGSGAGPLPRVQALCADQDQDRGRADAGDSCQGSPA